MKLFNKRKITKRELILAGAVLAVLVVFSAESVIRHAYADFKTLESRIKDNESKLFKLKSILAHKQQLENEYVTAIARYTKLEDSDFLLSEIGALARRAGFNIINMKPSVTKDEGNYRTYSIELEGQDDVADVAQFLYGLAEGPKRIGVRELSITSRRPDAPPAVSLRLNAIAFKR